MTKTTGNFTDFLDFSRNTGGTCLRRIAYGSELVTNGDFDTDTTGWTSGGGSNPTSSVSSGQIVVTATQTGSAILEQTSTEFEAGKLYQIKVDVVTTTDNIDVWNKAATAISIKGLNTGTNVINYLATDNGYLRFGNLGSVFASGEGFTIDNVSVKEVTLDAPSGDLVLFNHPDDIPRVEYDANGNVKGLLIEETRTNMIPLSEVTATDNQGWYDSSSVSTNLSENALGMFQGVSIASSGQNWHRRSIETASVTSGNDYAATVFYRAGTSNRIRIAFRNNAAAQETRISGEIGSLTVAQTTAGTVSILSEEDLPDNVKKITIKYTPNHSEPVSLGIGPDSNTSGETVIAYAAQFEAGPFATSYIPTYRGTATRSADIAHIGVDNFGHNKKVGTMVVDFELKFEEGGSGFPRAVGYGNSSNTNQRVLIFVNESTQGMSATVVTNNVTQAGHALQTSVTSPATGKVAFAFKDDDFAASRNGGTVLTDTAGDFDGNDDPRDVISIGGQTNNVGNNINGTIKSFQYYPRRLTNAQLQELTS